MSDRSVQAAAVEWPEWHAMSATSALAAAGADPTHGLAPSDAARRHHEFGPNRLLEPRRVTFWHIFAEEVREPMILLLIAVAVLYSVWGKLEDAVTIVVVIAAVVFVEVCTEFRAKAAVAALSQLSAPSAPTLRGGTVADVPAEELVPGGIVLLRTGERIPADARLIEATGLRADESALTGESLPIDKEAEVVLASATPLAERRNLVFAGTSVAAGAGRAVVVATGMASELGRIAGLVREAKPPRTPLQQAMRELAGRLARLAIAVSILIPLLGIAGGQPVRQMVLTGLTLAFATIPEELPILVTIVLGLGAFRLSRRHALIRRLRAAETLGEVSVIVTDKTGTLTENSMAVARLWSGTWRPMRTDLLDDERRLLSLAASCTDAEVVRSDAGLQVRGDPTDAAVIAAADQHHVLDCPDAAERKEWYGFAPGYPLMSSVSVDADGRRLVVTKGAPEAVLARCTIHSLGATTTPLDAEDRARLDADVAAAAECGLRVLAVAVRHLEGGVTVPDRDRVEADLTLVGLLALADPPRPEAADAISTVHGAGIRVVMVTGDHPATARSVAGAVGIHGGDLCTGTELIALDDERLDELIATTSTFARVTPADKLRIVESFRRAGQIVAVTGDGINDAPALSAADIGVAMGDGTDVAKEAADMILADDNFATIAAAVEEGRHLFDNLQKGIRYYLACKIALVATAAAGVLVGLPVAFAPIQIVVMEAFMDIAASTSFVAEATESDVMTRPPRDPGVPFMDRAFLTDMTAGAMALFAAVAGVYLWASASGQTSATAQTLAFASWMVGYVALAWTMRSERTSLRHLGVLTNPTLVFWTAVTALALVLATSIPALRQALRLTPLSASQWLVVIGVPVVAVMLFELGKLRWLHRSRATAR